MPNRCRTSTNSFTIKILIFQHNFFSVLTYMLKNQAELSKHEFNSSIYVQQKSCKTKKAQLFASKFRSYIFQQVKTVTYIVIWFGRGSADRTCWFGGSAEPSRTSKFGRCRCRCRFIGRSLVVTEIFVSSFQFFRVGPCENWQILPILQQTI